MVFVEHPQSLRGKKNLLECCYQVPRTLMRELSTVQNPAEILAFLTPPPQPALNDILKKPGLLLVLDRLQDPGNIGTIIRTSEAMGASAIVLLKGCCSHFNHKVIRAAMGSSFRLPIAAEVERNHLFSLLKQHSFATVCADMHGQPLPSYSFPDHCAFFFGQEGQGLADEIIKECNSRLAIPMQGQVESLNVATSAAICLYEWSRNRLTK